MPIRAIVVCIVASLAGCAAGPDYKQPPLNEPSQFAASAGFNGGSASQSVPNVDFAAWWKALGDPELDSLVERAVQSNFDLGVALNRLQQARTYESLFVSDALPAVDASAAAGRGTGSNLARGRATQPLVSASNTAGLQRINTLAGFDALWELDIFGKIRREIEAARYDTQAALAARNAVLTTVVADVVRAYVDLRGFQVQLGVLRRADGVLRESLHVVKERYDRGITNELDLALATRELDTFQAQVLPVQAQVNAARYTLAVLIGVFPESIAEELIKPGLVPSMPDAVSPGIPLELLKRRPDIQQAERELAASTARIGVATADLYPQVGLVGSIGAQSQGWGTSPSVGKHIWSFGPGALWPVLDFGALDAQVDIARLETQLRLMNYRQAIVSAVQQVDSALDGYAAQQDRLKNLGDALVAAERALDLATQRYNRGLTDYLNVVDSERQLYELQEQYAQAQVSEGEQFVQLYKSLGGGWEHYQALPPIRRPQPVILAAFRRALESSAP